jgi:hypothetical protein
VESAIDVSWFDVEAITHGLKAEGDFSIPDVWIDLNRGVFYYRITD